MNVSFSRDLLACDENEHDLDAVLQLIERGRHRLVGDYPQIRATPWFLQASVRTRKRIEQLFLNPADPRKEQLDVYLLPPGGPTSMGVRQLRVSLSDGLALLQAPVQILLENAPNDQPLIASLLLFFGSEALVGWTDDCLRSQIDADLRNPSPIGKLFAFQHGGGGTTAQVLASYLSPPGTVCVLVVIDRDARWPGHGPVGSSCGETGKKVVSTYPVGHRQLRSHVLHRREMENYLPDAFVARCIEQKGPIRAIFNSVSKLALDARCYWDVKDGVRTSLNDDKANPAPPGDSTKWDWKDGDEKEWWAQQALTAGVTLESIFFGLGSDVAGRVWALRPQMKADHFAHSKDEAEQLATKLIELM